MSNTIDLIYKQYKELRDTIETTWNSQHQIQLTSSEWYILNSIQEGAATVPEIMRKVEITKQAAHKFVKNLEDKGLLETELLKAQRVQRRVSMTPLGQEVYMGSRAIRSAVDEKIKQTIGKDNFDKLVSLLEMKWM